MRWRDTLIAAGSLVLGCNSLMQESDKHASQTVNAIETDPPITKSDRPAISETPANLESEIARATPESTRRIAIEEANSEREKSPEDDMTPLFIRLHHAELLVKHHREAEAKCEFELSIREAEEMSPPPLRQLVHCHSKLMELALLEEDDYAEHLHRGVGLYYLACQSVEVGETTGKLNVESLLCQAAGELSLAKLQRPEEARPCWFLYQVWAKLGQKRPAERNLRDAAKTCYFSYLTPPERRLIYLAIASKEGRPLPKR
jgi:hypothetical protein